VAKDRIVHHSDPETRHGRKSASRRFDGHEIDMVSNEDAELILGVAIRAANAGDGEGAGPLLGQIQQTARVKIDTMLGDMAYSDRDVRSPKAQCPRRPLPAPELASLNVCCP
jgi:hypothetical protein